MEVPCSPIMFKTVTLHTDLFHAHTDVSWVSSALPPGSQPRPTLTLFHVSRKLVWSKGVNRLSVHLSVTNSLVLTETEAGEKQLIYSSGSKLILIILINNK